MIAALLLLLAVDGGSPHIEMKFRPHRTGVIKALHDDTLVLQISTKTTLTVRLISVTIVHRNGREAHVSDLRVGDKAVIHVMPDETGQLDAVDIEARSPAARKKPAR